MLVTFIFIHVKTEEWNVYRRYAEFREFHQQIQRYLPDASSFNFPPKKTVGRKARERLKLMCAYLKTLKPTIYRKLLLS